MFQLLLNIAVKIGEIRHFVVSLHSDDNNIDYRTADSAAGHDARLHLRLHDARRDVCAAAEVAAWVCIGGDGGRFGMVVADSGNGDGGW